MPNPAAAGKPDDLDNVGCMHPPHRGDHRRHAPACLRSLEEVVGSVAGTRESPPDEVPGRLAAVLDHVRQLEKDIETLKGKLASARGDEMARQERA